MTFFVRHVDAQVWLGQSMTRLETALFNKVLETTWGFSIISTVKLCLVYTVLNIYLSTSVASIKREPFYENFPNEESQLSIN